MKQEDVTAVLLEVKVDTGTQNTFVSITVKGYGDIVVDKEEADFTFPYFNVLKVQTETITHWIDMDDIIKISI